MSRKIPCFLDAWYQAKPTKEERAEIAESIWCDWFCSSEGLYGRTRKFIGVLNQLRKAVDTSALDASAKNCCPCSGPLYDCLRIFDGDNFVCCVCYDDKRESFRFQVETRNDSRLYNGDDHDEMVRILIEAVSDYLAKKAAA